MEEKTIVCFGDSNTHGYNPENGKRFTREERYPCLLEQYLGRGYHVLEEGLSGRTTVFEDPLTEGLSGLSVITPCLLTHEPVDLLILMLGTNDTKERFMVNGENIAAGLERLAKKAINTKDAWKEGIPNILIISPVPIEKAYESSFAANTMGKHCSEKSKDLAFYYQRTASLLNCHFLDAGSIPGMQVHPNDSMHLTKKSHDILANKLSSLIPSLFMEKDHKNPA